VPKRKPCAVIKVAKKGKDVKIEQPPACYGTKEHTCRPGFCGEWFEKCEVKNDIDVGSSDRVG
jgi:hypothetical protein